MVTDGGVNPKPCRLIFRRTNGRTITMKSKSIKKLYTRHSWVGIITGILLFVIAFTGAVSVIGRPELKIWANPEIRSKMKLYLPRIERLVEQYADEVTEA